jgi:uncharacterized repeat protein (TIGR02543 family)
MTRKLLSLFLVLVMLFSLFPSAALAEGEGTAAPIEDPAEPTDPAPAEEPAEPADPDPDPAEPGDPGDPAEPDPVGVEDPGDPDPDPEPDDPDALPPEDESDEPAASSGSCGDDLTWSLSNDGVLTISGTGAMEDYTSSSPAPWNDDRASIKRVVINSGATTIGSAAFYECSSVTSISIPGTVTSIGNRAFWGCSTLTSITIPASVTTIGSGTGNGFVFNYCTSLTTITVNSSNQNFSSVDGVLFNKSKTQLRVCPAGKSGSYTMPDSVTSIAADAFMRCANITSVTFSSKLTTINSEAFCYCTGLSSVTLPRTVTSLASRAFGFCSNLSSITFLGNAPSINAYAFTGVTATASYPGGFASWTSDKLQNYDGTLTWSSLPSGECGAEGDNLLWVLDSSGKLTIFGSGEMASWSSGGAPWYSSCSQILSVEIRGATTIGNYAFASCTKLATVDYDSDLTTIGAYAFYNCYANTSLAIPATVTSLGNYAYYYNRSATAVSIPASVTSIGTYAFTYCGAVTSFTVDGANTVYCAQDGVLFNKDMTRLIHYPAGNARTSYTVPDTVTSLGGYAFGQAKNLTSLDLNKITYLSAGALRSCEGLTTVTIPDTVTSIGQDAFSTCTNLQSVVFGAGVSSLANKLFVGCSALTELTFRGNAPSINAEAFYGVTATAYYPRNNDTWTSDKLQNYGGTITWLQEVTRYDIWIDGVQVTSENMDDVLGNGVFRYTGSTNVYVDGDYTGSADALIEFGQYFACLEFTGDYTLRTTSTAADAAVVRCSGRLTIDGGHHATLIGNGGANSCGIQTEEGGFLLYQSSLDIYNVAYGIRCIGSDDVAAQFEEADLVINATEKAVSAFRGGVTLTGCVYANPAYASVDNGNVGVDNIQTDGFAVSKYLEISTRGYDLIINGIRVTEDNRGDVWGNGEFYYNPGTDTLNIYGSFDATGTWGTWQYYRDQPIIDNSIDGLTIQLSGDTTLTCGLENYMSFIPAIRSDGDLTILGTSGMEHPMLSLTNSTSGGGTFDGIHMVHGNLVLENVDLRINVLGRTLFGRGLVGLNDDCSVTFRDMFAQIQCDYGADDITPAALTGFVGGVNFENCAILNAGVTVTDGSAYKDGALTSSLDIATGVYDLYIEGERVYDGDLDKFWCSYDPDENTLTIDLGGSFTSSTMPLIENHIPGLTVYVENTTKLSSSASALTGLIESDVDMTIRSASFGESVACLTLNHSGLVGSGISMKNGAVLTLDRTRLVLNTSVLGAEGAALRVVDSTLEVDTELSWGVYGFTGGITLIGCRLLEPENGRILDGAIYKSDGTTVANSVTILASSYDLWIDGTWVTFGNKDDILGDGSFSYDSSDNTLTIHKSYSSGGYNTLIHNWIPGLTIAVPADVTLTSTWGEEGSCLISSECDLSITGPGKLTLHGCGLANSTGVSVKGENEALRLLDADVVVENVAYGVSGTDDVQQSLLANNSKLAATATAAAITKFRAGLDLNGCEVIFPHNYRMDADGTVCDSSGTPAPFVRIGTDYFRTVTFDVQGHGTAPETQNVHHGSCATEPDAPSAEGWLFDGWYTDAACTNAYDFAAPVMANITLYAKWIKLYELWVGHIQVTGENKDDILGDGTASYDPDTKTLTFTEDPGHFFYHRVDVGSRQFYALIWAEDDLTIQTPGTLTMGEFVPLEPEDNIQSFDVYCMGALTLNGDYVAEPGYKTSIYAVGDIVINGSVHLLMVSKWCDGAALMSAGGSVHITGDLWARVYRSCGVYANNNGIRVDGSVMVYNGLEGGTGLQTGNSGSLVIGGGTWDIEAERALDLASAFEIPSTHTITTPVGGSLVRLQDGLRYYTTVSADGTTPAEHVVIEPIVEYPLWLGETQVTTLNKDDIQGDGTASYDPDTQTLTFTTSEPNITGEYTTTGTYDAGAMIYSKDDLTIQAPEAGLVLVGGADSASFYYDVLHALNSLTINGDITIVNQRTGNGGDEAIYAGADLVIHGDLDATSAGGIDAGKITIDGNAKVKATLSRGIDAQGNGVVINIGGDLEVESYLECLYSNGRIEVGGNVTATSATSGYDGIYARVSITIGGSVTVTSQKRAVVSEHGKITVVSGVWDLTGGTHGIYAGGGIVIPDTHTVTTPVGGVVKSYNAYYTVTEADGTTVAKHVVIREPSAAVTVSFDACGGTVSPASVEIVPGAAIGELPTPTRSGSWVFLGWYTEPAATQFEIGQSTQVTSETTFDEDTTVYAHWRMPGDVNGDGKVNMTDVTLLSTFVKARGTGVTIVPFSGNIDGDANDKVNMTDVTLLSTFVKARGTGVEIH